MAGCYRSRLGIISYHSTAALTFFRQIGGTIALAAMGSVMTSAYHLPAFHNALPVAILHTIPAQYLAAFNNPQVLLSPTALTQIQSQAMAMGPQAVAMLHQIIEAVRIGLTQGIHNVFVLSLGLMVVGLIATFFLKEIPLRGGRLTEDEAVDNVAESSLAAMI